MQTCASSDEADNTRPASLPGLGRVRWAAALGLCDMLPGSVVTLGSSTASACFVSLANGASAARPCVQQRCTAQVATLQGSRGMHAASALETPQRASTS